MFTDKFLETLKHESVVAITSWATGKAPHATGTWLSYVMKTDDERLLAPAEGFTHLEEDIKTNATVLVLLGTMAVEGNHGKEVGIGFRLTATAALYDSGDAYELVKSKHPWCRKALELTPVKLEQLL